MTSPRATPPSLRQVLGAFATGVTIITTLDHEGRWVGLTANSFNSVSLDPPLILWSLSNQSPSLRAFREAQRFVVNILAEDQSALSSRFARRIPDKFAGVAVRTGLGGLPILEHCAAYLECTSHSFYPGGDHTVFFGEVAHCQRGAARPLVFESGRYARAEPLPPLSSALGPA